MKILTDEKFASIPAMIEQGISKAEIAAMCGVTKSTLQVQCSRRGVSLRKGGHLLPRRQLSLCAAGEPLEAGRPCHSARRHLQGTARAVAARRRLDDDREMDLVCNDQRRRTRRYLEEHR